MIDLRRFNPKKELLSFENAEFKYNRKNEFSLNEKEGKIWSYLTTIKEEKFQVIFQVILYQETLFISYTSDLYEESLRKKASEMCQHVKKKLQKRYPKVKIDLEAPIIKNMELYEENVSEEAKGKNKEKVKFLMTELTQISEDKKDVQEIFKLYGEEGDIIGTWLDELEGISFEQKEDGIHELYMKGFVLNQKKCKVFLNEIEKLGYCITYEEPMKEDVSISDLLGSGLIQIDY